jgi:hypothetical protein
VELWPLFLPFSAPVAPVFPSVSPAASLLLPLSCCLFVLTSLHNVIIAHKLSSFADSNRSGNQLAGVVKIPEYIASISYRNPGENPSDKTYFQYSNNTDLSFFQFMQSSPVQLAHFQKTMAAGLAVERQWNKDGFASIYPFLELCRAREDALPDNPVIVEVGGGHGHVIKHLRTTLPGFTGRMVVEDLPAVIEGAPRQDEVENVPYNFFTEKREYARFLELFVRFGRFSLLPWVSRDLKDSFGRTL